jgi:hypothetical protein
VGVGAVALGAGGTAARAKPRGYQANLWQHLRSARERGGGTENYGVGEAAWAAAVWAAAVSLCRAAAVSVCLQWPGLPQLSVAVGGGGLVAVGGAGVRVAVGGMGVLVRVAVGAVVALGAGALAV